MLQDKDEGVAGNDDILSLFFPFSSPLYSPHHSRLSLSEQYIQASLPFLKPSVSHRFFLLLNLVEW